MAFDYISVGPPTSNIIPCGGHAASCLDIESGLVYFRNYSDIDGDTTGWQATGSSVAAPVGSIQFNNNGSLGGSPDLTWDNVGQVLAVTNPTAATSHNPTNSPIIRLGSRIWNGSASVADNWSFESFPDPTIDNGTVSLKLTHSGSAGMPMFSVGDSNTLSSNAHTFFQNGSLNVLGPLEACMAGLQVFSHAAGPDVSAAFIINDYTAFGDTCFGLSVWNFVNNTTGSDLPGSATYGCQIQCEHQGANAIGTLIALDISTESDGTQTNPNNLQICLNIGGNLSPVGGPRTTTTHGIFIEDMNGAGAAGLTNYGIHFNAQSTTGGTTTWAIFEVDTSCVNQLGPTTFLGSATGSVIITDTAANTDLVLKNTTAATSGTSQSSPLMSFVGEYWNGSASAPDSWTLENIVGNGTNGLSQLTFAHSGSTGAAQVLLPTGTQANPGIAFSADATSGIWLNGASNVDIISGGVIMLRLQTGIGVVLGASQPLVWYNGSRAVSLFGDGTTHTLYVGTGGASGAGILRAGAVVIVDTAANTDLTIQNTTAATNVLSQSSPFMAFTGQFWNGSVSGADTWSVQNNVANGTNGQSILDYTHVGTSGTKVVRYPEGTVLCATSTANARLVLQTGVTVLSDGNAGQLTMGSSSFAITGDRNVSSASSNSASWKYGMASELLTLSTSGTTTDTVGSLLPANAVIDSVVARVTTTITTATSWELGDATTAARFTSPDSTMTAGETQVGLNHVDQTGAAGPKQIAAAKVRVTTAGIPGAGAIRISVFYRQYVAPGS